MAVVTIVGAGMMGSALCWPLADNGHEVRLVGTHLDEAYIESIRQSRVHPKMQRRVPDGVTAFRWTEIPQAVAGADVVVSGVSSFGVHWFAAEVGPYLTPGVPVIAVTKGLEADAQGDLRIFPEVTEALLPEGLRGKVSLNAIGGPCISHELAARRDTGAVFTGRERATLDYLGGIFRTPYYHVWVSTNVIGVEVCAALKNGYAMGVSLAAGQFEKVGPDGLGQMYNPQAFLFAQGVREMGRLIQLLGGDPAAADWLPGAGDLYVTVFGGRTARLGRLLGQGESYPAARLALAGETLEAAEIIRVVAQALPALEQRGLLERRELPLLRYMATLLTEGAAPSTPIPWDSFFAEETLAPFPSAQAAD